MFVRSLLLITAMLLLIAAVSSVVAPRELRSGRGASSLGAAASNPRPPAAPGEVREETMRLPADKKLTVRVGDIVHIEASAETDDVVDIPELGVDGPVSPGIPATFDVITDLPGTFPIRLRYGEKTLGTLEVRPAA